VSIEVANPIPLEEANHAVALAQPRVHQVRHVQERIASDVLAGIDQTHDPVVVDNDVVRPKIAVE
jgi:hypothetical protein